MYRHSAQLGCLVKPSLPSPEHTSDSESDLIDALHQKRRQLDHEIHNFKSVKDNEFREFERDLRTRRKRARGSSTSSETSPSKQSSAASTASVLNLLASAHNGSTNGWNGYKSKRNAEGVGEKITRPAPSSRPTLSLDKLTITGETTPPTSVLGSPPTPSVLTRTLVRSPSASSTKLSPPRSHPEKSTSAPRALAPPTPTTERADAFAGVFLPTYLPLLESREHTPIMRSPQPLTPQEDEKKQLEQKINVDAIDRGAKAKQDTAIAAPVTPTKSHSLPQQSLSPTVVATKRTHSTPQLPSTSLPPSALRHGSGNRRAANGGSDGSSVRKRKHVTFQLADSAIVDPSSSYEELPSPEPRNSNASARDLASGHVDEKGSVKSDGNDGQRLDAVRSNGSPHQQPQSRKKKSGNCNSLSPNDTTQRKGRRLRSPAVSPLPSPSPSPTIPGLINSSDESGFSGGLAASVDGGSGVGFFELDEELASPAFTEDRSFEFGTTGANQDEKVDDLLEEKKMASNGIFNAQGDELQIGSFAAGSVPIDIVRPSLMGSWVSGSHPH